MAGGTEKGQTRGAGQGGDHNLLVALRVRPMSDDEILQGSSPIAHRVDDKMVVLFDPMEDPDDVLRANRSREKSYVFDVTFDGKSDQQTVYNSTTRFLIQNVINGYNATVFAYGATGAGKTYTMLGTDDNPGIMVRTLNDLFLEMERTKEDMSYKVTMSYLEIYNEMIRDLLNPSSGYLELREDSKGVQVAGLSEASARSTSEVMDILMEGNKERTQEPTAANKASSRSHAVLQVVVKQQNRIRNVMQEVRIGKLYLIDLAGSERAANTHNRGKRMVEGAHINRSLLALGNCINALSDKNSPKYINYRDSKLTRLLKDALGGNCKTVMIAHISPASLHFEESRNTLVYADRAKQIKTKVRRNVMDVSYHIAQYTQIIDDLREEISRLREKLDHQALQNRANIQSVQAEVLQAARKEELTAINRFKELLLTSFKDQMELRRSLMELNNTLMEIDLEMSRNQLLLNEYEAEKARNVNRLTGDDNRTKEKEKALELAGVSGSPEEPGEVKAAREDMRSLLIEKDRTEHLKVNVLQELEDARNKSIKVEEMMPRKVSSEEQREILSLMCRVHELEIENMEMQSTCLVRDHEIRMKEIALAKYEHQRNLYDEIIQQQRVLITDNELYCPKELEELYDLYEQSSVARLTSHEAPVTINSVEPYKATSVSNMTRQLLNAEKAWENGRLDTLQEESSSHQNHHRRDRRARKQILKKSSNNMSGMDYDEADKIFSKSPKAKMLQDSHANMDGEKLLSPTLPREMVRQPSIITLSSRSTHSTPTPTNESQQAPKNKHPLLTRMSEDPVVITTSTRNIAALAAAKRKNKSYSDTINSERQGLMDPQFNRTYVSLKHSQGKNSEVEVLQDDSSYSHHQRESEVYLSPKTLARHNMKYSNTNHNPTHVFLTEDIHSTTTADYNTGLRDVDSSPFVSDIPQRAQRKTVKNQHPANNFSYEKPNKDYTKKNELQTKDRTRDYTNSYQQMSPEQFFKQLAKSTVRKGEQKTKGRGGPRKAPPPRGRVGQQPKQPHRLAPEGHHTQRSVPSDVAYPSYSTPNHQAETGVSYSDKPAREFEPAEMGSTTVHQTAPEKGRGMTLQRKVRGPANYSSGSSSASTPLNADVKPRGSKRYPPPTIPNYRKGSMSVTGYGLNRKY